MKPGSSLTMPRMRVRMCVRVVVSLVMLLGLTWTAAAAQDVAASATTQGRKPNVVLIVADDLGYADVGCQGQSVDVRTPHIDSIATSGVRFTNAYVSGPVCSPTRAALLTGRYQQRFGFEQNPKGPTEENVRSEERRVGKECRGRWRAAQEKK